MNYAGAEAFRHTEITLDHVVTEWAFYNKETDEEIIETTERFEETWVFTPMGKAWNTISRSLYHALIKHDPDYIPF